jgi:Uma2 family endonuclease
MNQPQPENISLADFLSWEQQQPDRYEWIDGAIVRCAGGSFEHATIISNLNAIFHAATRNGQCFVQGSDRKLVPRDVDGNDLGSFYADLFVSCAQDDRRGDAAHLPTLVIEVLSAHVGPEFTRKKEAYLGSARLTDYLIIDSTRRYVLRFAWSSASNGRHLVTAEYRHGPISVPTLGLTLTFDQIYAGTDVPAILHPIRSDDEEKDTEVLLD